MATAKQPSVVHRGRSASAAVATCLLLFCWGAHGAVIRDDRADALYTGLAGQAQFASVGSLSNGCSGTLIKANAVLTAAHCLDGGNPGAVTFTVGGNTYNAAQFIQPEGWTGSTLSGHDIGVVRLTAPVNNVTPAKRYSAADEVGKTATLVGFGRTGTGLTGDTLAGGTKRAGENVFDGTLASIPRAGDTIMTDRILLADFDNPNNAADNSMGAAVPRQLEVMGAPGDSGGGWFIGNEVAGVQSYRDAPNFYDNTIPDNIFDSDYGDVSGATRVSSFSRFIDRAIAQTNLGIGSRLPTPQEVTGKEYSDRPDKNAANLADPEQNLYWDGTGNVNDTFDYSGSRAFDTFDRQVDALANGVDALYNEVVADEVFLTFSTSADPNIYYETPGAPLGGVWATPAQINAQGVVDVDALELWGPQGPGGDDATAYSLEGDPNGIAVYTYNATTNVAIPYLTTLQIAEAIGRVDLVNNIDLDALMMFDWTPDMTVFDAGDRVMFSIAPILNAFDGGEIWVWDGMGPARFLFHGGHLWDTAFDVMGTFGTASENINALEAIATPEASTLALLLAGLGLVAALRRLAGPACRVQVALPR